MTNFKNLVSALVMSIFTIACYTLVPTALMLIPTNAEAAECTLYETMHPNFLLSGAHLSTGKCETCASCHAGGIFLGTPTSCAVCHSGTPTSPTVGRSAAHIPIGPTECDACHGTLTFTSNVNTDHDAVASQQCDSCHNGSYEPYGAAGKHPEHIPTVEDCGACHLRPGDSWDVDIQAMHVGIVDGCATCHNGTTATGKTDAPFVHPTTSDNCETCHSVNEQFKCVP